jgi:hypothetical protein
MEIFRRRTFIEILPEVNYRPEMITRCMRMGSGQRQPVVPLDYKT